MLDAPFSVPYVLRLRFTEGAFEAGNRVLLDLIEGDERGPGRVLIIVDAGVLAGTPGLREKVEAFLAGPGVRAAGPIVEIEGGENCKNDRTVLDRLLGELHRAHLCRRSYIVVVGGGAVLDVVGFAAAIFHRGIRLIRVPTTTLAQADSGIGVKSAVNFFGTKNLVGAFAPPWGVVNDEKLLTSLNDTHWRDGFSEAVKVALLKDAAVYRRIEGAAGRLRARDMAVATPVIRRSAELHMEHITRGGDPFEFRQARPLDYGHWAAHKLEQMTGFEVSHGHAVSIGLALDALYAELREGAAPGFARMTAACLDAIGLPVHHPMMTQTDTLLKGLEEFREHLGGRLTVTLVLEPGRAVDVHEIDMGAMRLAALGLAELAASLNDSPLPRARNAS